jgi:hypothetical protein
MAKIKFPLVMADDEKVSTIEKLKEHFDIESVLKHYLDGKLLQWLGDRYYEDEMEAVAALDSNATDFKVRLAAVFGKTIQDDSVDLDTLRVRNERIARLKKYTDDEEIIKNIDLVAFDQEEFADLLDDGAETIYLCDGNFSIPKSKQDLNYIEVGEPVVVGKKEIETLKEEEEEANNDLYRANLMDEMIIKISEMPQFEMKNVPWGGVYSHIDITKGFSSEKAANDYAIDKIHEAVTIAGNSLSAYSDSYEPFVEQYMEYFRMIYREYICVFLGNADNFDEGFISKNIASLKESIKSLLPKTIFHTYNYSDNVKIMDFGEGNLFSKRDYRADSDAISKIYKDRDKLLKEFESSVYKHVKNYLLKMAESLKSELNKA